MADQYQNFSNPTIVPEQQYGWQGASQSIGNGIKSFAQALMQRQAEQRNLQLGQAQEYAKAQAEVWAKLQDPLAQALERARLAQGGFPVQMLNNSSGTVPSMAEMLQGNPYAKYVQSPNLFSSYSSPNQGSPSVDSQTPSVQATPSTSFNPLAPGNPVANMVQTDHKVGPYGTEPERQFTDINAANQVAGNKAYADQIGQAQGKQASATSMLDNITKNLAADLKSHFIEAGGGGPIKGRIAGFSTNLGMSPATSGLKNTIRDSSIAYARDLAGGSQGVQRMFQAIMETIPGPGATQEQAGTALLQMHLTAAQLQAGMTALGLSPQDMSKMNEEQIKQVMSSGNIDRQAETDKFSKIIGDIQPTNVMDMSGKLSEPKLNSLVGMFGKGKTPNSNVGIPTVRPAGAAHYSPSTKKFYDAKGNEINATSK